jgi:hypothetical protein
MRGLSLPAVTRVGSSVPGVTVKTNQTSNAVVHQMATGEEHLLSNSALTWVNALLGLKEQYEVCGVATGLLVHNKYRRPPLDYHLVIVYSRAGMDASACTWDSPVGGAISDFWPL